VTSTRVLIVEGDENIRGLMERVFVRGFAVGIATEGVERCG
jgi:hypothetical protein